MTASTKQLGKYLNSLYIRKSDALLMIFLLFLYASAEFGGISILAPIIQVISEGSSLQTGGGMSSIWGILTKVTDFLGVPLNLVSLLVLAFFIIIVRQVIYYLQEYHAARIRHNSIARMRIEIISQSLEADLDFFLKQGQGRLLSAASGQAARAGDSIFHFLKLLSSVSLLAMYVFLLFVIQPALAGISVVIFSTAVFLSIPIIQRSKKYSDKISRENTEMMKKGGDEIYGIRLVKMFSQEKKDVARLKKIIYGISEAMIKADMAATRVWVLNEPLAILAILLICYIAVFVLDMALASLGVFLFVMYRMTPHIKGLNLYWQKVNSHSTSLDYVEKILESARESSRIKGGFRRFGGLKREIEFDNVSFSYEKNPDGDCVLENLSFRIPKGSFTAIVGPSGAGKSTLVDLIPRLRDVTSGEIRFDGVAIREFDLKSLRSRIGYLSQEPFLFNDTLLNNMTYGLEGDVSGEDVREAAKKAFAHEFIEEMPLKYKTDLGDRGIRLSGGQRQRIALAKLILHDPDIIILDEYTSSLDSESERFIQAALAKIIKNRTMVVIAHRLATIKKADMILVLEKGKISEFGDFQTLMKRDNSFRRLFEEQLFF